MKEKTLQNTYWPFELDKIHDYAFWNNAFTPRECEQIIEIGSKKNLKKGTVIKFMLQMIWDGFLKKLQI